LREATVDVPLIGHGDRVTINVIGCRVTGEYGFSRGIDGSDGAYIDGWRCVANGHGRGVNRVSRARSICGCDLTVEFIAANVRSRVAGANVSEVTVLVPSYKGVVRIVISVRKGVVTEE
jgi:hypothetical protein